MHEGFFGLPRITDLGPLVNNAQLSASTSSKPVTDEELNLIFQEGIEQFNINRENPEIENLIKLSEYAATRIYSSDNKVSKRKRLRLLKCVGGDWATQWVNGMNNASDLNMDKVEQTQMRFKGCMSLTENHTPDHEELLP